MLPCVWLHFKKFSGKYFLMFGKEEGKHKSENTKPQSRKKNHQRSQHKIAIDGAGAIWIAIAITERSRSRIAIDSAIAIWIAMAPDRDLAVDHAVGLELELAISDWIFSSRARALSLSLSLSGSELK